MPTGTIIRMSNESKSPLYVIVLCGIILFLTVYPLLSTGYTTADDVESLTATYKLRDVLTIPHAGGRLSYFFSVTFGHLRTLSNSFYCLKFFYIAPIIALIFASTYVAYSITRSKYLALIYFCLICLAQQNFWQHNSLTAYPGTIQIGFLFFLLSIPPFRIGYIYKKKNMRRISWVLFGLSLLTYEMMLPFVVIYLLLGVAFSNEVNASDKSKSIIHWFRAISSHVAVFLIILIAYIAFRQTVTLTYGGAIVSEQMTLVKFLKTLWALSMSALPPRYFYASEQVFIDLKETFEPFELSISYLLFNTHPEWIIRMALVALLVYSGIHRLVPRSTDKRRIITLLVTGIVGIFLPNLLFSLTPTKQEWVDVGVTTYTGSYFSVFSAMIVVLVNIEIFAAIAQHYGQILKKIFAVISAIVCAAVCYMTDYTNHFISKAQSQDYNRWRIFDEFMQSEAFKKIPDNALIYAPSLWQQGRYWGLFHPSPSMDDYWNRYTKLRSKKNVHFARNWSPHICNDNNLKYGEKFFYIRFFNSKDKTILALSPLQLKNSSCGKEKLASQTVDILLLSRQSPTSIAFALSADKKPTDIFIDGNKILKATNDFYFIPISGARRSASQRTQHIIVSSNGRPFDLEHFNIITEDIDLPISQ